MSNARNPGIEQGSVISGFKVLRQVPVDSIQVVFTELEHIASGARHIHLSSDDDNNFFMATFRTLPQNSTGLAHILEHAILEGSLHYPVKIYMHLTGRSLNTFLNAMTSADYTAYPVSSRNKKDFFNLLEMYLDATFQPLLDKSMFLQEGWRYEFEKPEDPKTPLMYKGVVYNEMKGAMSNPLRLFHEYTKKAIFPDLIYSNVSGGDPQAIPNLTYEEWVAFHRMHYHASNAYFFTFGSFPLTEILARIDNKIRECNRVEPKMALNPQQPGYPAPKTLHFTYPIPQTETVQKKTFVAVLWKLAPAIHFYENLKLSLLNLILCGNNSSMLNRSLLSSNLGGGLAPVGFDNSYSEGLFGAGLKDADEGDAGKIEALILGTLADVAEKGIPDEEVEAALHQLEFATREIKGDRGMPYGFSLALQGLPGWINGGDFLDALTLDRHLARLKTEASNPEFFKNLIEIYYLKNSHRVTLILTPDSGGVERQESALKKKLEAIRSNLSDAETQSIIEQSRMLKAHQDATEDLSCMPKIELSDISPDPLDIPQTRSSVGGIPAFKHPIPTNGITYAMLEFDHDDPDFSPQLAHSLLPALTDIGAGGRNYVEMGRLWNLVTGSVSVKVVPYRNLEAQKNRQAYLISARCLPRNHARLAGLLSDLLLRPDVEDTQRFAELINMQKAYALPTATFEAHRMANMAAGRHFSSNKRILHNLEGFGYIQKLLAAQDHDATDLLKKTCGLLARAIDKSRLRIGCTGDGKDMDHLLMQLSGIVGALPDYGAESMRTSPSEASAYEPEAWVMNLEVSYVAKSFPAVYFEHADSPVLLVLSQLLELPLYDRIRAKGGAYGAFASYDYDAAAFSFLTYRDPHTGQSLNAMDAVIREMAEGKFTDERLEQSIIETIRNIDVPPSPREKGISAFFSALNGKSFEQKKKYRSGILSITRSDIERIIEKYLTKDEAARIAIVTSDEQLKRPEAQSLNLKRISLLKPAE